MTPDERAADRPMLERFKRSPAVHEAIYDIRLQFELERARRSALLRKRALLALEIILGMAAAAIVLAVTFGFLLEHAK